MVKQGLFREDLFYRINLVTLHMPTLRERRADIPALIRFFAKEEARIHRGLETPEFDESAIEYISTLPLPGNVRELRNIVARAALLGSGSPINVAHLRHMAQEFSTVSATGTLEGTERRKIAEALTAAQGNVSRAAAALGISRGALYRRMEKYGLQ